MKVKLIEDVEDILNDGDLDEADNDCIICIATQCKRMKINPKDESARVIIRNKCCNGNNKYCFKKCKNFTFLGMANSTCKCNSTVLVRGQAAVAYAASLTDQSLRSTHDALHAAYPGTTIPNLGLYESRI